MMRRLQRLRRDERGAAVVEFAIIAPVMSLVLLAGFDISHTLYTRAVLQGIVQKTARDATLESGTEKERADALDLLVRRQALALVNNATVDISRRYYRTFTEAAAAKAEPWTDTNKNGRCDNGEPYQDNNLNSVWDSDGADAGQGGAKDAVVYTVTMKYDHLMPVYNLFSATKQVKLTASTVLRNQPYGDQGTYGAAKVRNCT